MLSSLRLGACLLTLLFPTARVPPGSWTRILLDQETSRSRVVMSLGQNPKSARPQDLNLRPWVRVVVGEALWTRQNLPTDPSPAPCSHSLIYRSSLCGYPVNLGSRKQVCTQFLFSPTCPFVVSVCPICEMGQCSEDWYNVGAPHTGGMQKEPVLHMCVLVDRRQTS